jgi:hypothetical protein
MSYTLKLLNKQKTIYLALLLLIQQIHGNIILSLYRVVVHDLKDFLF